MSVGATHYLKSDVIYRGCEFTPFTNYSVGIGVYVLEDETSVRFYDCTFRPRGGLAFKIADGGAVTDPGYYLLDNARIDPQTNGVCVVNSGITVYVRGGNLIPANFSHPNNVVWIPTYTSGILGTTTNTGYIYSGNRIALSPENRLMLDSSDLNSIDWEQRTLNGTDGNAAIEWGTGGLVGQGGGLTVVATGFNGNLATTDDTLQEIAQKLDDLTVSATFAGAVHTNGMSIAATFSNSVTFNAPITNRGDFTAVKELITEAIISSGSITTTDEFIGPGSGLTAIPAAQLTGTIPWAIVANSPAIVTNTDNGTLTTGLPLVGNGAKGAMPTNTLHLVTLNVSGTATAAVLRATSIYPLNINASNRVAYLSADGTITNASASGAVPINADGTASTFAQVQALSPGYIVTNGMSVTPSFNGNSVTNVKLAAIVSATNTWGSQSIDFAIPEATTNASGAITFDAALVNFNPTNYNYAVRHVRANGANRTATIPTGWSSTRTAHIVTNGGMATFTVTAQIGLFTNISQVDYTAAP